MIMSRRSGLHDRWAMWAEPVEIMPEDGWIAVELRFGVRIDLGLHIDVGHTDWTRLTYRMYHRCADALSFPGNKFWTTHVIGSAMYLFVGVALSSHRLTGTRHGARCTNTTEAKNSLGLPELRAGGLGPLCGQTDGSTSGDCWAGMGIPP